MHRILAALLCVLAVNVGLASTASAGLEVPTNGGEASGIGFFAGWKCPPNGNITLVIDGGSPFPVATGISRGDTAAACGNGGFNGFISEFNFSLLGDGNHTVSVRQNGTQFSLATFHVTTFGQHFLSGASGSYVLQNFPQLGQTATVEWSEGAQNFIITGKGGAPPPPAAQVRYGNDLTCFGANFESTLSANGFTWVSDTGVFSPYQSVNRTTLGPFTETNDSSCTNIQYPGVLALTPGRRYSLVQTLNNGNFFLAQIDDGPVVGSADPAEKAAVASSISNTPPLVLIPGVASPKAEP